MLEPKDTAVNQHAKVSTIQGINFCCAPEFLNTGIVPKWSGLNIFLHPLKPQDTRIFSNSPRFLKREQIRISLKQSDILTAEENC